MQLQLNLITCNGLIGKCDNTEVIKLSFNGFFLFLGVVMAASMMVSVSRTLVLGDTLALKTTPQGPLTQDPNRARDQRLDMPRAKPGVTSDK